MHFIKNQPKVNFFHCAKFPTLIEPLCHLAKPVRFLFALALFISLLFGPAVQAADGYLDTTFGTDGIVTTAIGSTGSVGEAVAMQSDGKIVVVGWTWNGSNYDFAVVRYESGGADTLIVNTTDDELNSDGDCSLREAIHAANTDSAVGACSAGSGDDTITLPAGTYTHIYPDQHVSTNCHALSDTDCHADGHPHKNIYPNQHVSTNYHTLSDTDCHFDCHPHKNIYPDQHASTNCHARWANPHPFSNTESHLYCNTHADTHAD